MTGNKRTRSARRPSGRPPYSTWWLLAKNGNAGTEVFTVNRGGERTLPVFSGEGEAEMFLWLRGAFEDGWHARETSSGELVSLLSGPCAGVGSVALDPSLEIAEAEPLELASMDRKRFIGRVVALGGRRPAPGLGQVRGPRSPERPRVRHLRRIAGG